MTPEPDVESESNARDAVIDDPAGRGVDEGDSLERAKPGIRGRWLAVTAMASGLGLGLLLAASFGIGSDIGAGDGLLFAQGALAQALSGEMSGNHGIGPSFWSNEGYFCRAFDTKKGGNPGLDGIACRERGGWRIRIVTTTTGVDAMPASVRSTMDSLIVGSPLDATAERQARRQGWRPG